jgi:hypothetical protein
MNNLNHLKIIIQKIKQIRNQEIFRRKILPISIVILLYFGISFVLGYRFTPEEAAKANEWVNQNSILMGKEDFGSTSVYLYEYPDKYYTVITDYKFPFWRSSASFWANKTEDNIKLVGWCSYGDKKKFLTVVPIQNYDKNVAYIEMGPVTDRIHKETPLNQTIIFSWNKSIPWNDLNAIAYSKDKEALYHLGYEIKNSTIISELRWLPIEKTADNLNN